MSKSTQSAMMYRLTIWRHEADLRRLLYAMSLPRTFYVLGAGASYGLIPTTQQMRAVIQKEYDAFGIYPAERSTRSALHDRMIGRPRREPTGFDEMLSEIVLRNIPPGALEFYVQRALWLPAEAIVPPNYAVFDVVGSPATLFSFNIDGLAFRFCRHNHTVLEPHGRIDRVWFENDKYEFWREATTAFDVTLPHIIPKLLPSPEPPDITQKLAYEEARRLSQGSWRGDSLCLRRISNVSGGSTGSGECLRRQILQICQVLRPRAGRLVLAQTSQTDHGNDNFLHLDHLFFCVTRCELDAGNRSEDFNPNWNRPHANDVVRRKKQVGRQPWRGEPELAKRTLDSGGIFRMDIDPDVQIVGRPDVSVNVHRVPPMSRYSTPFELSNFKNSLKSSGSDGMAIRNPAQVFERPQPLLDWAGQPVCERVVRIRQARDGKLRAVQPEFVSLLFRNCTHTSSLLPILIP